MLFSYLAVKHKKKITVHPIKLGVSEGSVPESLLYHLFITNLLTIPNTFIVIFADSITVIATSVVSAYATLQEVTHNLQKWTKE